MYTRFRILCKGRKKHEPKNFLFIFSHSLSPCLDMSYILYFCAMYILSSLYTTKQVHSQCFLLNYKRVPSIVTVPLQVQPIHRILGFKTTKYTDWYRNFGLHMTSTTSSADWLIPWEKFSKWWNCKKACREEKGVLLVSGSGRTLPLLKVPNKNV